jgi:CheY-like chemotaxis protein
MAVILVIDDAATVRLLMRRVLAEAQHTVIEAPDGDVGLSLFADQRPALVITDLFMPNREGIETIQQLRRLSPAAKIIAMSSSSTASGKLYLGAAKKLGANAILAKPFNPAELIAAVDRVLAGSAEGDA